MREQSGPGTNTCCQMGNSIFLKLEKFECPWGKTFEDFPREKLGKFEGVGSMSGTKKRSTPTVKKAAKVIENGYEDLQRKFPIDSNADQSQRVFHLISKKGHRLLIAPSVDVLSYGSGNFGHDPFLGKSSDFNGEKQLATLY